MSTNGNNGDCGRRWEEAGYIVQYYGIGDPDPYPYNPPCVPNTLPTLTVTPPPELEQFKRIADMIHALAAKMPGRKKVKKLQKRLKELEERVAAIESRMSDGDAKKI